jgi:hypothetical protein
MTSDETDLSDKQTFKLLSKTRRPQKLQFRFGQRPIQYWKLLPPGALVIFSVHVTKATRCARSSVRDKFKFGITRDMTYSERGFERCSVIWSARFRLLFLRVLDTSLALMFLSDINLLFKIQSSFM